MTDETEVVESTHVADGDQVTDVGSDQSNLYSETQVSQSDRTVTFWNRVHFGDTTIPKQRKIVFFIEISGHGITETGSTEQEYYSPLGSRPYLPAREITVPTLNLQQYRFEVKTVYELYNRDGIGWTKVAFGETNTETATVIDNGLGG